MKGNTITMEFYLCLIVGVLLAAPLLQSQGSPSGGGGQKTVVLMAEGIKGRVSYKVDSQPVTDLLLSLSRLEERRGPNNPVIALIDPRLPIEEIWSIDGTAGKAQFTNVRFFIFFRDTGKMSELRQMPAIPFSTNPPTE
jgi:hypothetical protein